MESRFLGVVALSLLLLQTVTSQCIGSKPWSAALAYAPELSTTGGSFLVLSKSPIAPTGVSVLSDQLVIEGPLAIDGQLPFLGTVSLGGTLPSIGSGNVAHACGGPIGISEITPVIAPGVGLAPLAGFAPGFGAASGLSPFGAAARGPGISGGPLGLGMGAGCGRVI